MPKFSHILLLPMKTLTFILFLITALSTAAQSPLSPSKQTLYGNVFDQSGEPVIGATVQWDGTTIGTVTDEKGDFWIEKRDAAARLVIQYVGYDPVSVEMFPHEDTVYIKVEGIAELESQISAERPSSPSSSVSRA